ncbi:MAG: DUF1778 domain-containing protein [Iamia sp.]
MAVKTGRIEARLSPEERERIERAATMAGLSTSNFMVSAAVERADAAIAEATTTTVPDDYFDELLAALDDPSPAPRLAEAAAQARRRRRIDEV